MSRAFGAFHLRPPHTPSLAMTSTLPPRVQATSGGLGAAFANALTYPLDLIVTRIQLSNRSKVYPGDVATAQQIIHKTLRKYGILGLYSGLESDSMATLTSNFLYFYVYSYLRAALARRKAGLPVTGNHGAGKTSSVAMLSVPEELFAGFLSGVVSKGLTTPLSVITVQLQSEDDDQDDEESGIDKGGKKPHHHASSQNAILRVVRRVYSEQGIGGFWQGMSNTIILCSNPALTMLFLQAFRRLFLRGKNREQPTGAQGFIGGAVSNTLAVLILYPLILSKTRLQSYSKGDRGRKPSLVSVLGDIIENHGVAALYQGLLAQLLKGFFNQGITMMVKQRIETGLVQLYHKTL